MLRVKFGQFSIIAMLLLAAAVSCSRGGPVQVAPGDGVQPVAAADCAVLVDPSGLDALKGPTAIQSDSIDVTTPLIELNTQVNGEHLDLMPTATELAWAIFRVEPPAGSLLSLEAAGSDILWLMVADYERGWV